MSLRVPKLIRPLDLLHNPPPKRKKKQLYICTYNYIQFTTSSKINDKLIRRNTCIPSSFLFIVYSRYL
jgi:hypothetical protein